MALKVTPTHRADNVKVGAISFQVWWENGRPHHLRILNGSDDELTLEHLRAFIAWCDGLPTLEGKG
jgi:hypothetical protein